ncbi:hypothetical protein C5167_017871 [Papaver somniferum]|uniref:Uncharacterized protein n=1 Tax=Papaver somniferum TaxID=3469 RepID=A0A4Y7IPQ1_PAPSO|nr:hypothetical protein C5167_017871 [Papaver somniferum]
MNPNKKISASTEHKGKIPKKDLGKTIGGKFLLQMMSRRGKNIMMDSKKRSIIISNGGKKVYKGSSLFIKHHKMDKMIQLQQQSVIEGDPRDKIDIYNEIFGTRLKRKYTGIMTSGDSLQSPSKCNPEDASRYCITRTRDVDLNVEPNRPG